MKEPNPFSFFIFLLFPIKTLASVLANRDFAFQAQHFSFVLYLVSFVLFFSCSQPTESNKVTYSGTVTLADTGFPLCPVPAADTALARINEHAKHRCANYPANRS